ncbi:hypothetical protein Aglo02_24040 [Actinokineospora globicatena]|nr:hypothetical protein Aglo02_24040 [Actinokineospora globicatena]
MGPETTACSFLDARAFPGGGDVLAREPRHEHVHRLHDRPVHGPHVTEIRYSRHPRGQDPSDVWVGVGDPGEPSAEHGQHAQVQSTGAGAQRPENQTRLTGRPGT